MVLGIIGIARGAVNVGQPPIHPMVGQIAVGDATPLPLVPLAAALLFVGGLIILAKRDGLSALDNGDWQALEPHIVPRPAADLNQRKTSDVSSY
jgi:hypothetical protein